jgi:hypothetical protein
MNGKSRVIARLFVCVGFLYMDAPLCGALEHCPSLKRPTFNTIVRRRSCPRLLRRFARHTKAGLPHPASFAF